jgi:maltose/moltooligosaccharide transporter
MEELMNSKRIWGRILLLGLGFFALGSINSIYEAYMPEMLSKLISASTVVGLVMGLDNLIGMIFFPYFGALSDRTESRLGKRLPFVLIGMPLVGLGMIAIPFGAATGVLILLVLASLLMNFAVTVARSPLLAMMPDSTPAERRPIGFGIMMSLLGFGSIFGLGVGRKLYETNVAGPGSSPV